MGYTPELRELIKRVEATRSKRLEMSRRNEHYPALSLEEREEVLNKFHPDYQKEGRRALKVGPNKGDLFQDEVADLLESRSMIRPENVDLSTIDYDTDVLIIGGGGAGTSAALMAVKGGAKRDEIAGTIRMADYCLLSQLDEALGVAHCVWGQNTCPGNPVGNVGVRLSILRQRKDRYGKGKQQGKIAVGSCLPGPVGRGRS